MEGNKEEGFQEPLTCLEFPCTGVSTFLALLHQFLVSLYFDRHTLVRWTWLWLQLQVWIIRICREEHHTLTGWSDEDVNWWFCGKKCHHRAGFCPDRQGPADNWLRPRCIWSHGEPSEWESSNICRKYCTCRGRIHLVTSDHGGEVHYEIVEHNWIRVLQSWSVSSRNSVTL